MRKIIALLCGLAFGLSAQFAIPPTHGNGNGNRISVTVPVAESRAIGTRVNRNPLVNCEDKPVTPCITWDESEWRLVTDYKPYTYITLFRCPTEDSDNCYWDARKRGNHKGNSFVTATVNGKPRVYYY